MTHYFYLKIHNIVNTTLTDLAPALCGGFKADHHSSYRFNWDLDLLGNRNGKESWRGEDKGFMIDNFGLEKRLVPMAIVELPNTFRSLLPSPDPWFKLSAQS